MPCCWSPHCPNSAMQSVITVCASLFTYTRHKHVLGFRMAFSSCIITRKKPDNHSTATAFIFFHKRSKWIHLTKAYNEVRMKKCWANGMILLDWLLIHPCTWFNGILIITVQRGLQSLNGSDCWMDIDPNHTSKAWKTGIVDT